MLMKASMLIRFFIGSLILFLFIPPVSSLYGKEIRLGNLQTTTLQASSSPTSLLSSGFTLLDRYKPYIALGVGAYIFSQDHEVRGEILEHNAPHGEQAEFYNQFEPWGTAKPYFYVVPAFLGHGLLFDNKHSLYVGGEIALGISAAAILTRGFKEAFGRLRPFQTSEPEDFFHGGNAFYSGHTVTAFTFATILAKNYPKQRIDFLGIHQDLPVVPVLAYSLATMVGLQRIYSNVHWTSDVYVGAIMGYLIGTATVKLGDHIADFGIIPGRTPQVGVSFFLD
jgi:membrane-associated phospholipid phosphatase